MKHLIESKAALPASLMAVSALYGAIYPTSMAIIVFVVSAALAAFFTHLDRNEKRDLDDVRAEIKQLNERVNGIALISRGGIR